MFALELALKSSLLLAAGAIVLCLFRNKSAAFRHLVWSLTFGSMTMLPFLSALMPSFRVPVAERFLKSETIFHTDVGGEEIRGLQSKESSHFVGSKNLDWLSIITLVWASGTTVGLGQVLIGWLRLERLRSRAATLAPSEDGVELIEHAAGGMPMTYGLFRPVIFLPPEGKLWSAARLRIVIKHELAHVRRDDCGTHVMARGR